MHLALKSAMSRIPYTNKVGETLSSIADPAAAYSLRALGGGDPMVARVRRSSDDAEKDFTASDMDSGSVADWVNGKQDTTLPCDVASAAAAYSLRSVNSNYTGSVVRVRRSSDDAEKDFTAFDMGAALEGWVNEDVVTYQSDFSSGTDGWNLSSGNETSTFTHSTNKVVLEITATGTQATRPIITKNNAIQINKPYLISFNYNVISGTCTFKGYFDGTGQNATPQETLSNSGTKTFQFLRSTGSNDLVLYFDSSNLFNLEISSIQLTQLTADGHVTTWYDQSGNGNNATQSTASSQPKIVDGGTYLGELDFDGVDFFNTSLVPTSAATLIGVATCREADGMIVGARDSSNQRSYLAVNPSEILTLGVGPSAKYGGSVTLGDKYLAFGTHSGTTANISLNGVNTAYTGTTAPVNTTYGYRIGTLNSFGTNVATINGLISEVIVYNSDQSANRFKIESNINNHYDLYTNANDGFVTSWYDQSGNDNDATQGTAGSQPKIVDGGVLLSDGIEFDGASTQLSTTSPVLTSDTFYCASVLKHSTGTSVSGNEVIFGQYDASSSGRWFTFVNTSSQLRFGSNATDPIAGSFINPLSANATLISATATNNLATLYSNGNSTTLDAYSGFSPALIPFTIGKPDANDNSVSGTIQEIIIYNSDQSSNRAAIEANINNYYDIY